MIKNIDQKENIILEDYEVSYLIQSLEIYPLTL